MIYNFDKTIVRRGTDSVKWNQHDYADLIPLWVADMDFPAAQPVVDALAQRVQHAVYGYATIPTAFYSAVMSWSSQRHKFVLQPEWILPVIGVVPALSALVSALTSPGDKVLVQEPVYHCFFSSIERNQAQVVSNDLIYRNGEYTIDFEDFEHKASDPKVKLFILCSPHNPAGRVWTRAELERLGEICLRHQVLVISDEIHCDLVFEGYTHIPFGSISAAFLANSITCVAPSKTFNLAGLQVATVLVADPELKRKVQQAFLANEISSISPFAITGLIAAYEWGGEWLDQALSYIHANYLYLKGFMNEHLPALHVFPLEGTYLVWVDCAALGISSRKLGKLLLDEAHVQVNVGAMYGKGSDDFIRLNIACSREVLTTGLLRLKTVFSSLLQGAK
ncbi:MalY/PatB family protein [Sphingobacterium sp. 40-24]|jgi:cystathionine beta-lyase|uniref:MalY/PatB family protein n=1 Tax=Sphingobacterium sp. 40-24 TaxID=1895843 RepID=UPI0009626598|nr:MalY/PatB family protein [Sphingobacterium sp. 40-24]MDF2851451.1 cystathionine beta-lyase [Sphingobacterium multivorum]OJZ07512.1 MAG: cystathionine beta-lyase [Sphingobacterium sp. 40-24]